MDAEINNFMPIVEAIAYVWSAIAIMGVILVLYFLFVPAKQKDDILQGKRKFALILTGLSLFFTLIFPVFMIYLVVFNELPSLIVSLIVLIVIVLICLVAAIYLTFKLYYLQIGAIETRDLFIGLKNKHRQK